MLQQDLDPDRTPNGNTSQRLPIFAMTDFRFLFKTGKALDTLQLGLVMPSNA